MPRQKGRGVLGIHYRGHGNEREAGYEEMRAQRQKAPGGRAESSPRRLEERGSAVACGTAGAVVPSECVALPVPMWHQEVIRQLAVPTGRWETWKLIYS